MTLRMRVVFCGDLDLGINWPVNPILSDKDINAARFSELIHEYSF